MKAIVYTQYGSPDVLQLKEVQKPAPKENEILVRVRATSVNRTDCANLRAKPFIMRFAMGLFKPKKIIMGTEFAGDVEKVGEAVTTFKAGDKVFGFDDSVLSSYAEYLVISVDKGVSTIPENYTYQQAGAGIEGAHYAYNIINKVNLKKGQKVMVNGASGGIGSATVQLLNYFGAEITGVCNTKNLELVKSLGAKKVIDYTIEDFTKDQGKYDYVFDTVGKSTFGKCKLLLKPGGSYISSELGPWSQNIFYSLISAILGSLPGQEGKTVKFPYPPNIKRSVLLVKKLIEEGKFKSVIDRSYPFEEVAEAFRYVEKGQKTGNVSIIVSED
ncbi:MAG: NAD(P)-dependent alcohol dehydrogenase [Eudoraea sp.]|uniref:NAD(P)-dependent alcohol dehydrogenase n=1 Tax=Eudoraea sp. TaxID=1979955 RepID=UPI0032637486